MYNKCPGQLAKLVRVNVPFAEEQKVHPLPSATVREHYEKIWGSTPQQNAPALGDPEPPLDLSDLLPSITPAEVKDRISRTKKGTAPGPDGIKKADILSSGVKQALHIAFNVFLASGVTPTQWRANRTTLLLKDGKPAHEVTSYRPITITSIIGRLFWGIVDQKLRRVVRLTPRQKGFVPEGGCFNNVHILNELLRYAKKHKGLVVVQLDIAKAFDMVPHNVIGPALRRKGVPEHVVRLVTQSYVGARTEIKINGEAVPISLERGVKQGDPLSPLLFNLVTEPLLFELERQCGYTIGENAKISCLAFADDIILVADDVPQAKALLECTERYLGSLGMGLSADKCRTFNVKATRDSWYIEDPALVLQSGEKVPYAGPDTTLDYLGAKISPWRGIDLDDLKEKIYSVLQRVKRLALKPHQKVELISTYLVPHYLYSLVLGVAPVTLLREIDRDLRVTVKEILHLPSSTCDGLLYANKRDGGLGFPKLEIVAVTTSLVAGLKLLESPDPAASTLAASSGLVDRLKKLAKALRMPWPVDIKAVLDMKRSLKKRELERWGRCIAQGKCVEAFKNDPVGNAFLYNPGLLKPSRQITALQMRADVAATRVAMNRATPLADTRCRRCKELPETLGHVLGQCVINKGARIRRHDEILNFVERQIPKRDKEAVIMREPRLHSPALLKPDLVVKSQGRVLVVDVTVRHEDGADLECGREDKVTKYSPLLPQLTRSLGAEEGEVVPIVVGTRGALPKSTQEGLRKLGIQSRRDFLTISLMALRSSIEIFHTFMDYNAPPRVRSYRPRTPSGQGPPEPN